MPAGIGYLVRKPNISLLQIQLSQTYCYDTGIPAFFSIVMVIISESGPLKIKDTIRNHWSCQCTQLI